MSDTSKREWRFYLDDMIDFAEKVMAYTEGLDQAGFEVRIRLSCRRKIAPFFSGTNTPLQQLKVNLVVCRQTISKVSAGASQARFTRSVSGRAILVNMARSILFS